MNQNTSNDLDTSTILIVDDTPSNLSVVVNLFEEHGYRVAIAQDGEEGLQRAQLVQPDLIMLDVMMPGIDGFEVCLRLKAQESTREIPVIFMTALASSEHKVRGFEAGGIDYVTKPLQINEVMARVDTHLKLSAAQKQLAEHNEELERRVAERTAELNESKERYRLVFENSPVSIWEEDFSAVKAFFDVLRSEGVHDIEAYFSNHPEAVRRCAELAKIVDVNLAAVDLHAAGCKDALFAGLLGTFTPESFDAFRRELIGLWNGKTAMALETVVKTLTGELRNVIVHFSVCPGYERSFAKVLVSLVDITERKQAERELLLLNLAVNTSSEAAFLSDAQGRFVYVNDEACRSLGYSREELLTMTPLDIDPDITGEMLAGLLDSIFSSGPSKSPMESRHRTRDGRIFPIEIAASPLKLEGKNYCLTMVRDITERKRAERELHLLNRALDNSFDATYLLDTDLRIRYVNEAAVRELGYSREELLSMSLLDIDPNMTREMVHGLMGQTAAAGRFPGTIELQHRRKNGEIFPVEIGATLFSYEDEPLHLTTVRNITERKEAERLLHEKEQAIRAVVENSPDAIARYDAQLRRIYVNPSTQKLFDLPLEQILGKTPNELQVVPADEFVPLLESAFERGQEEHIELPFRKADGEMGWGDLRIVPEFGPDGSVVSVLSIGRDITERKHAESALRESEQRYREIFENVTDSLYLVEVTPEGRFRNLAFNAAFEKSTGIPREALIGHDAGGVKEGLPEDEVVTEETARSVLAKYRHCVEAGVTIEEDSVLDLPSGVRHYHSTLVPLRDESGRIYRILGVAHDVTEIKRVEREFRTLAENIPDHIIRYDSNARKIYVNMATARLMGVKPEAILNQTPEETPEDIRAMKMDEFARRVRLVLETGEPQEFEATLRHKDDGMRVHNVRFVAERDEQGKIVGALMVGRDITAMKAIENELLEREQRYHEIFDNAVEGMYLLEVTEEGRFRNIDINPALAASTGIPREAMIGRFVDETVSEEIGRITAEKYRRCVAAGRTITEDIELDLPAGKRNYLSTITPIRYGGRIHRLIGISRDITELKKAERALEESRAKLRGLTARREEAREEERKYIAREVHDELGQILTGLQLNVSVLTHKFAVDSPALREQLQETRVLTDRALAVARNVASALRPAALDMGIVSALEWLVGRFGKNTGIRCEVHAEDMEDIQLDESQAIALFRIVQESLTNVARHAKADRIDIEFGMMGDDYSLKVRDNGAGFDEKTAKADSFGLVGMRERALLLGGEVVINSKPGEGTEIEVRIPAYNVSGLS